MHIFPDAKKRALLTAYADTNAAISAINEAKHPLLSHEARGILRPSTCNPQLDDLLERLASFLPAGLRGNPRVGDTVVARSYELRDFLARNRVPYQWIDVELSANDPETHRLLQFWGPRQQGFRSAVSGRYKLLESVPAEVAQGWFADARANRLLRPGDCGRSPAGLAAAVYGASEGLHTVMIERSSGWASGMSARIENYLDFRSASVGGDLARARCRTAQRFGVEILSPLEAVNVRMEGPYRFLKLADGERDLLPRLDDCDRRTVAAP